MKDAYEINFRANVLFGAGSAERLGELAARYGKKAMVVTCPWIDAQREAFTKLLDSIKNVGADIVLFDRAVPNPTTISIEEAAIIARREDVDLVVGIGGGSAIDTAKAVALEFAHEGGVWKYTYAADDPLPIRPEKLLPVIAVTTTSGTGSHVTPYAVLQSLELRRKTGVVASTAMIPAAAIVDPRLVLSLPPYQTAVTGFDAFAHAFESYTGDNANPFIETLALRAMEIAVRNLSDAYHDGANLGARREMAFADTLAGMCITINDTNMPHQIGQAIVGKRPDVTHGQALSIAYPKYIELIMPAKKSELAKIARLFDPSLTGASDGDAAAALKDLICDWMRSLGIYTSGEGLGMSEGVMSEVIEEIMITCPFLTNTLKKNRSQVTEIIRDIWYR